MGRKSSAKAKSPTGAPPPDEPRGKVPLIVAGLIIIALFAVGTFTYLKDAPPSGSEPVGTSAALQIPGSRADTRRSKAAPAGELAGAPVPRLSDGASAGSGQGGVQVAAEHPEVMSYVPCFCGCERMGHRGNEELFRQGRDVNGDKIVQSEDHQMECARSVSDVAPQSLQCTRRVHR